MSSPSPQLVDHALTRRKHKLAGYVQLILVVLSLAWAPNLFAFKIETHVWLADQIFAELNRSNGSLNIAGRNYPIRQDIARAIINHRGAFLMGVMGADIYPDMLAGQMTTHPGVNQMLGNKIAWQTDDWLDHVLGAAFRSRDDSAIAFACGYLLHAAMDMWAHTYVNLYAGDVFLITESPEVAERHVAMEAYLRKFHQTLLDYGSYPSGDAYTHLKAPASFVRSTLILNDRAAEQYAAETSTQYLWAIHRYYQAVGQARSLATELRNALTTELARIEPLLAQLPQLRENVDKAGQAFNGHIGRLMKSAVQAIDFATSLAQSTGVEQVLADHGIHVKLDRAALAAKVALEKAQEAHDRIARQIGYGTNAALNPDNIRGTFQTAINGLSEGSMDKWQRDIERAMDAWVVAWEDTGKELMRPHGAPGRDPARPMKVWATCWGPVLGLSVATPPVGVSEACAQGLTTYHTVRTNLDEWKQDLISMIPVASQINTMIESFFETVTEQAGTQFGNIANLVGAAVPQQINAFDFAGFSNWLIRLWDKDTTPADLDTAFTVSNSPRHYVRKPVSPAMHRELGVCTDVRPQANSYNAPPFRDFAPIQNAVITSKLALLDSEQLNNLINDYLGPSAPGKANPKKVPTTRQEAQKQSVPAKAVTTSPLLTPQFRDPRPVGAVLIGALRSIDGDHAWQPTAPPLPRANQYNPPAEMQCRRYGYPSGNSYAATCNADPLQTDGQSLASKKGFLLWQNPALRSAVFNRLFKPVAPELCNYLGYNNHPGLACSSRDPFPAYDPSAIKSASYERNQAARISRSKATFMVPPSPASAGNFAAFQDNATEHSWSNSYLLALLSYVGYPGVTRNLEQAVRGWGLDYVDWVNRTVRGRGSGSTQFLVVKTRNSLIFAFRGSTISFEDMGQDWIDNDLDINPRPMDAWGRGVVLHDGFYDAAAIVFSDVLSLIKEHGDGKQIWMTGHSLGGAVAVLNAFNVQQADIHVQGVYLYGAPPVGNARWQSMYDRAITNTHRWSMQDDPVASVMVQIPGPFRHVGKRHNLLIDKHSRLNDQREWRYPLATKGLHGLVADLSGTHLRYWCRLHTEATQQGKVAGLPIPPNSECDLCSY